MREVSCYMCGSAQAAVLEVQNFDDEYLEFIDPAYLETPRCWKVCADCGFVYHTPHLDEADVAALYEERYREHSLKDGLTPEEFFDQIMAIPKAESENYAKVLWLQPRRERWFDGRERPADRREMLDIGCSAGMFIRLFVDETAGWTGAGVEPTRRFAELGQRRLGLPVQATQYRSGLLFLELPDISDFRDLPPEHDRLPSCAIGPIIDDSRMSVVITLRCS